MRGLLGIRRSACAQVFEALAEGAFIALVSPHIVAELRAVFELPRLRSRYRLSDDQIAELVDAYGHQAEMVPGSLLLPSSFRSAHAVSTKPAVPVEDVPIVSAASSQEVPGTSIAAPQSRAPQSHGGTGAEARKKSLAPPSLVQGQPLLEQNLRLGLVIRAPARRRDPRMGSAAGWSTGAVSKPPGCDGGGGRQGG